MIKTPRVNTRLVYECLYEYINDQKRNFDSISGLWLFFVIVTKVQIAFLSYTCIAHRAYHKMSRLSSAATAAGAIMYTARETAAWY